MRLCSHAFYSFYITMEFVMNRRKVLNLMIAIAGMLTVVIAESFIDPNAASAQTCTVKSLFGGRRCTVTCPPGTFPSCKSGLFSVQCRCHAFRGHDSWPLPVPPVSAQELDCARRFRDFLRSLGDSEAAALADAVNLGIVAIETGNVDLYSDAENIYVDLNDNASPGLKAQINAWLAVNPDCVWPDEPVDE